MIRQANEKGFVLATSLVMLMLMTILTAAVFISVDASQKSSMAAESSAQAFYYAETAVEYMKWSLDNDVEFDSYTYPNIVRLDIPDTDLAAYSFGEPDARGYDPYTAHPITGDFTNDPYVYLPIADVYGDYTEWRANRFNPSGNDVFSFSETVGGATINVYGQLMYYDNSPLANRVVSYQTDGLYTNGALGEPTMFEIHKSLPRYIMLSIDDVGNITPSIPPYDTYAYAPNFHGNVMGTDYPKNGALIWLTGGNRTDDLEIDPMDTYFAPAYNNRVAPGMWDPYTAYVGLSCDLNTGLGNDMQPESAACLTSGAWVDDADYGLVIYAIGYVRGKPQRLVRVVYE